MVVQNDKVITYDSWELKEHEPNYPIHDFRHVVKLWDIPTSIISDCDARFIGTFWIELFKLLGSSLNISLSYHPQIERFNSMLEKFLRHFENLVALLVWREDISIY